MPPNQKPPDLHHLNKELDDDFEDLFPELIDDPHDPASLSVRNRVGTHPHQRPAGPHGRRSSRTKK